MEQIKQALSESLKSKMARPRGFEPLTFGSGGQRSIHLSYGRVIEADYSSMRELEKTGAKNYFFHFP